MATVNTTDTTELRRAVQVLVLRLFNEHASADRLVYHNYRQAAEVAQLTIDIGERTSLSDTELLAAELAAWFCTVGYLYDYQEPMAAAVKIARQFMQSREVEEELTHQVYACLYALAPDIKPELPAAQLVSDAHNAYRYTDNYERLTPLYRLEWELMENPDLSNAEWEQLQASALLNAHFYLPTTKRQLQPIVATHLIQLRRDIARRQRRAERRQLADPKRKYQQLEPNNEAYRAAQTFFRTNYRNHINLSAIADNKANILIGVNSILIGVILTILSYGDLVNQQPAFLLPVAIFLLTGMASLVTSVMAARPSVTKKNSKNTTPSDANTDLVFFGNFVHLDLDTYEAAMDSMLRDGELIYGNMTRDLYYLGQVLDRKYKLLKMSYNLFMIGFIVTVAAFIGVALW